MALVCVKIEEKIQDTVIREVDNIFNKIDNICEDLPWPLDWFCHTVVTVIKTVTKIVDIIIRVIIHTVCKIVVTLADVISDVFSGVIDIIAGIATLKWGRIVDGIVSIVSGIANLVGTYIRIAFLGDLINFVINEIKTIQLKNHVRDLLEEKYHGDVLDAIKEAIGLDAGTFGFRLSGTAIRAYFDSSFRSDPNAPPDLWQMHDQGKIDLKVLCGFDFTDYLNRSRHIALRQGLQAGGGASGPDSFTISEKELDTYIANHGENATQFFMMSMSDDALQTKLNAAEEVGRDLGVILHWDKSTVQITKLNEIIQAGTVEEVSADNQTAFMAEKIGRIRKSVDEPGAKAQLCQPVGVGVFRYASLKVNGLTNPLYSSNCVECVDCEGSPGLDATDVSGFTFKDRQPDFAYKYVPIHEFGHYLGLCHVGSGLDRIMFSPVSSGLFSFRSLYEYFYFSGRPSFMLKEAKQAWEYIIANFDQECLMHRHE